MPRLCILSCLLLFCLLSAPKGLHAQAQGLSSNPNIQKGLLHYNAQEYKKAAKAFRTALADSSIKPKDKVTALKYMGFIAVILNNSPGARKYFMKLLSQNPKFTLGDLVSPKFSRAFEVVRKEFMAKRTVKIEVLSPKEVPTNQPLEIRLKLTDHLRRARQVIVWHRIENAASYRRDVAKEVQNPTWKASAFPLRWRRGKFRICAGKAAARPAPGGAKKTSAVRYFSHTIPKFVGRAQAYFVEYYIVIYGKNQSYITALGSGKSPLKIKRTIPIKAPVGPKKQPIYTQWWLWTIVGVAVVGAAAAVIIPLSLPQKPAEPTTGGAVVTIIQR